jgi:hypothetical protein
MAAPRNELIDDTSAYTVVQHHDLAEWLRCAICHEVRLVYELVFCKECGGGICRSDMDKWRETQNAAGLPVRCPRCRASPIILVPATSFNLTMMRRVEDSIAVQCRHCQETVSLRKRVSHMLVCPELLDCFFCSKDGTVNSRIPANATAFEEHLARCHSKVQVHRLEAVFPIQHEFTWTTMDSATCSCDGLAVLIGADKFACMGLIPNGMTTLGVLKDETISLLAVWINRKLSRVIDTLAVQTTDASLDQQTGAQWVPNPNTALYTFSTPAFAQATLLLFRPPVPSAAEP